MATRWASRALGMACRRKNAALRCAAAAIARADSMTPTARPCQHTSADTVARLVGACEHVNTCTFTMRAWALALNDRAIFISRNATLDKEQ